MEAYLGGWEGETDHPCVCKCSMAALRLHSCIPPLRACMLAAGDIAPPKSAKIYACLRLDTCTGACEGVPPTLPLGAPTHTAFGWATTHTAT